MISPLIYPKFALLVTEISAFISILFLMRFLTVNLLLGAALGLKLGHQAPEPEAPPLWIKHVQNQAMCDDLNTTVEDLYVFDQAACACFLDESKLPEDDSLAPYKLRIGALARNNFGALSSSLSQNQVHLQCQIDQIYNHGLDGNCQAIATQLDYDYRATLTSYYGSSRGHGQPNTEGYDENGHFG